MERETLGAIFVSAALIASFCLIIFTTLLYMAKVHIEELKLLSSSNMNKPVRGIKILTVVNFSIKQINVALKKLDNINTTILICFDSFTYYIVSVTVIMCTLPVWAGISQTLGMFSPISFIEPALSFAWIFVSIFVIGIIRKSWKISISTDRQSSLRLLAAFHTLVLMAILIPNIDIGKYSYYIVSYLFFLLGRFVFIDSNKEKISASWTEIKSAFHFIWLLLILLGIDLFLYFSLELNTLQEDVFFVFLVMHCGILMVLHVVKYKSDALWAILPVTNAK